tara:strand:- start:1321 stop:1971 length:651 start_codon:yes stop_codon:yes gene_type:complete
MKFDELQKAWQQQDVVGQVKIEGGALLKLIRRNHRTLEGLLFRRDFIEVTVALLLVPVWIWMGTSMDLIWTWYLVIPGLLWIAGFFVVDRLAQRKKRPQPGDPLRDSVKQSLSQIEHQIYLLKNILWWYLLPVAVPLVIFTIHQSWLNHQTWGMANQLIFFGLVFWGVYEMNQWAVRKKLKPEHAELLDILESLDRSELEVVPDPDSPDSENKTTS